MCSIFNPFWELALFFKGPGPVPLSPSPPTPAPCEERVNIYFLFICFFVLGWVRIRSRGSDVAVTGWVCTQQSWCGPGGPSPCSRLSSPHLSSPLLSFANCCSFQSPFTLSMYSRLVTDFPLEQVKMLLFLICKAGLWLSCHGFSLTPPLSNSCKSLKISLVFTTDDLT